MKEVTIELFRHKRNYKDRKNFGRKVQVPVMSTKIVLEDDELYTEKTDPSECVY